MTPADLRAVAAARQIEKIVAKAVKAAKALPSEIERQTAIAKARRWGRMAKRNGWDVEGGAVLKVPVPSPREGVRESRAERRERMAARYDLPVDTLREIERQTTRKLKAAKALRGKERERARVKALAWSRAAKRGEVAVEVPIRKVKAVPVERAPVTEVFVTLRRERTGGRIIGVFPTAPAPCGKRMACWSIERGTGGISMRDFTVETRPAKAQAYAATLEAMRGLWEPVRLIVVERVTDAMRSEFVAAARDWRLRAAANKGVDAVARGA